jgi:hypothetical protein
MVYILTVMSTSLELGKQRQDCLLFDYSGLRKEEVRREARY